MVVYKKKSAGQSVLDMARERISHIYDRYDHVAVSFSGGKDSTVCLQLTLDEARKRGRLPLDVVFFDEEAIPPETVEYVQRVAKMPDVALRWYCFPILGRNACSRKNPWWYPWDVENEDLWCRPMPKGALTTCGDMPRGTPIPNANPWLYPRSDGKMTCVILGVRADESLSRYRAVATKIEDNYMSSALWPPKEMGGAGNPVAWITLAKPIYDWTTDDVWVAPALFGWDYNRAYDTMMRAGISKSEQRVAPPYAEEPLRGLWQFKVCWPELWHKMLYRVPGAATGGRYGHTELFASGAGRITQPPPGSTWREYVRVLLDKFSPKERKLVAARIKDDIDAHNAKTNFSKLEDATPHPITGLSWQFIAMIALRGDFKKRKIASSLSYSSRAAAEESRRRKQRGPEQEAQPESDSSRH